MNILQKTYHHLTLFSSLTILKITLYVVTMPEIQNIKISKLSLLEKNPRKIDKIQFEKLCKSLQDDPAFLQSRPILVHKQADRLVIYAGNQRVRAAKKIGWKEIPCIVEENLSDDLIKSRTIKDNKTYGEFDYDLLANEFDMEMLFDAGFNASDFDGIESNVKDLGEDDDEQDEEDSKCPTCGK